MAKQVYPSYKSEGAFDPRTLTDRLIFPKRRPVFMGEETLTNFTYLIARMYRHIANARFTVPKLDVVVQETGGDKYFIQEICDSRRSYGGFLIRFAVFSNEDGESHAHPIEVRVKRFRATFSNGQWEQPSFPRKSQHGIPQKRQPSLASAEKTLKRVCEALEYIEGTSHTAPARVTKHKPCHLSAWSPGGTGICQPIFSERGFRTVERAHFFRWKKVRKKKQFNPLYTRHLPSRSVGVVVQGQLKLEELDVAVREYWPNAIGYRILKPSTSVRTHTLTLDDLRWISFFDGIMAAIELEYFFEEITEVFGTCAYGYTDLTRHIEPGEVYCERRFPPEEPQLFVEETSELLAHSQSYQDDW
ncbi:hypothetical protein BH11PAT4_BH11PAT4_0180 [soil metagenome]